MKRERGKPFAAGFTLIEALVVLAILAAILLISIPALYQILQNYYLKTSATQLAIHIRLARNQCVTQKVLYRVTVRSKTAISKPNTYTVEYAPHGTFMPIPNLDVNLPKHIEILDSPAFTGGIATIQFNVRGGATSATGTPPYDVSLKARNGLTYRVRVQLTGEVEVAQT